jgi:hypothetical protein
MTAVELLISSIEEQIYRIKDNRIEISISEDDFNTLKKESKRIEKQEIEKAFINGNHQGWDAEVMAEQYYNETYGSQGTPDTSSPNIKNK